MKNFLVFLVMLLIALPALAQSRRGHWRGNHHRPGHYRNWPGPRYPMPRPAPRHSCQVVMVDRYQRVINRYWSYADYRYGQCSDGLRQCHWDLRRYGAWGARCAQVR